jgi:hypothetical protein
MRIAKLNQRINSEERNLKAPIPGQAKLKQATAYNLIRLLRLLGGRMSLPGLVTGGISGLATLKTG